MVTAVVVRPLVLIVEDDADVRDTLGDVLEDEGYRTLQASNGLEALARLRDAGTERPGIVLLDIMMPVMDGPTFRAEQLRDPALADIPVIALSAHAMLEELGADLGVAASLRKPIALDALLSAVERVVREAQPQGA